MLLISPSARILANHKTAPGPESFRQLQASWGKAIGYMKRKGSSPLQQTISQKLAGLYLWACPISAAEWPLHSLLPPARSGLRLRPQKSAKLLGDFCYLDIGRLTENNENPPPSRAPLRRASRARSLQSGKSLPAQH